MLYNRLTDSELERAVYVDPTNVAARNELLARAPGLVLERAAELEEAEDDLARTQRDHAIEVENLQDDLRDAEQHGRDLAAELDTATARIAELTRCGDLV